MRLYSRPQVRNDADFFLLISGTYYYAWLRDAMECAAH